MPDQRVFVPMSTTSLTAAVADGVLPVGTGFAVTGALREWYAQADTEELEYVALTEAAQASLRLVDADPSARPRRVVLAVDVPEQQVTAAGTDDDERAVVRLGQDVPLSRWRAALVDAVRAEPAVAAAAQAVVAADLGSTEALTTVEDTLGHELMWFGVQEIAAWLQLLDLEPG